MFLIEQNGNAHIWNNSLEDDFIRFLPANLKCKPEDLLIHYVPDNVGQECAALEQSGGKIEAAQGKIRKLEKVVQPPEKEGDAPVETWRLVEEISLKPLVSSWPYKTVNGSLVFCGIEVSG